MHKSVTHIAEDGEGEAAIGVATSPLRSGRRLGSFSEKLSMQDFRCATVSGGSFLHGIEIPKEDVAQPVRAYSGFPFLLGGIPNRTLEPTGVIFWLGAVERILRVGGRSQIPDSVVQRVAVFVINDWRDIADANPLVHGVKEAVDELHLLRDADVNIPTIPGISPDVPSNFAGIFRVPSFISATLEVA